MTCPFAVDIGIYYWHFDTAHVTVGYSLQRKIILLGHAVGGETVGVILLAIFVATFVADAGVVGEVAPIVRWLRTYWRRR